MNNLGFTGTRQGMTLAQKLALEEIVSQYNMSDTTFHHGGCHGADCEAHNIAALYTARIVHPGGVTGQWAERTDYGELRKSLSYLERNRNIVDETELLIAAPKSLIEEQRSGTWSTVRYARKVGKPVIILDPAN